MAGQVGWAAESTWGTGVTPTVFMPVLGSTFDVNEGPIRSEGIRAGRFTRQPARLGARTISGTVEMEAPNVSIGVLLRNALGGTVVTTGTGPYTHTFTPSTALAKSFTLQTGVTATTDTVHPFTATGAKVSSLTLSGAVPGLGRLSFDWTAKDLVTATALATASYSSSLIPFSFIDLAVSVNGTEVSSATAASFTINKNLKEDHHVLGSRYIREQRNEGHYEITSEITASFDDLVLYALSVAGTQVACVHTYNNGTDTLTITTSGQVVSAAPSLSTVGQEEQTIRLDHSHATSDASACTIVLVNGDATP